MKQSIIGINILRCLASQGLKIFNIDQAKEAATQLKVKKNYVAEALHHCLKGGWISRLKKGVYAFSGDSGFIDPPHDFEIAMALVSPCSISHWTAMNYHNLTEQSPNIIFALTPSFSSIPRSINKDKFHFIKIKKEYYFGFEKIWVDQSQVLITDLERTLLDGLMMPEYCGDFQEVLHAFKISKSNINIEKIIHYALKLDKSIIKRLGWILEKLNIEKSDLKDLLQVAIKSYRKLDPRGPSKGPYNRKWMIQENIGFV
jgi:predicted transcriptional regulator of viral defense system